MADAVALTLDIIKLAVSVATSLTQYIRSVKDVPKVVNNIALEVAIMKGILEYLGTTLEGEIGPGSRGRLQEGLAICLNECRETLFDVEKLVVPENESDSDSSSSSSRTQVQGSRTNAPTPAESKKGSKPDSPFNHPAKRTGLNSINNLLPPLNAVINPEPKQAYRYSVKPGGEVPVRTATPTTKKVSMSFRSRLKWPLVNQRKADEMLRRLERQRAQLSLAVQADNSTNITEIRASVENMKAVLDDNEKRRILSWLKPNVDMYEFHAEQHDKQEDETCEWIIGSQGWRQWLDGGPFVQSGYKRFIWIFGIPGAGKTVLCSFLIDAIGMHCQATGYSFYYCHHERNHDETIHFLRWIICDLSRQIGRFIPPELEELSKGERFSIPGLMSCFSAISKRYMQQGRRIYLVLDAVDESRKPRERFLDVLIRIGTDPDFRHVSLLMTSREETDIKRAMDGYEDDRLSPGSDRQHTAITMSNADVMLAIRMDARGMFRWVACQIDIIERLHLDTKRVIAALKSLPETLFDTYARILEGIPQEQRAFARTALALICSNTSNIKSADVLVQASLHNVRHGAMHMYNVRLLKKILGCLIKVTNPQFIFKHDDDGVALQRVSIAHYTVREFLFAPPKGGDGQPRPAGEFALTDTDIRMLEMQVVFNGLQQWGRNRPPNQRSASRYEEHCLEMSDSALRGDRRNLILKSPSVFHSVMECLKPNGKHVKSLRNERLRRKFPKWRTLCAFNELDNATASTTAGRKSAVMKETGILASLILLQWPEFAKKLLRTPEWEGSTSENKNAVWTDEFTIDTSMDESMPKTFNKNEPVTLLRLCVSWKRLEFLEIFIDAGANFAEEPDIVFVALRNPYGDEGDDGQTTGQLLKMILETGADPNPPGFLYTPLQDAVRRLEESWVQSLLLECRDANAIGDPNGAHPYDLVEDKPWHRQHPLDICRTTRPLWEDHDGLDDQIAKARKQIELLLIQYGACRLTRTNRNAPAVIDLADD
ncbi:hypothetical protein F5B19DRAFT_482112 [Rostrohypoxylon terebratum]|nr:hypothetical protein F5B19DRAFT_482112 [Rostrohypoxylon terebratum]